MQRIESLTDAQRSRFPEFVRRWTDIGLCTDPANRTAAEEGIRLAYRIAGLEQPRTIVWCGSPLSQEITRAIIFNLRDSVVVSVRDSVVASVRASVWDSVVASVRASVWDSVVVSVRDSVYGQHDAHWLGFYDYFREVCNFSGQTRKLCGLSEIARNAGWWLPYRGICWISERPSCLRRDEGGRLHCPDGPALTYPDGWSIYAISGVRVDEQVVMRPGTQTVDQIKGEPNAEIKRIRLERYGWPRYLREIDARVVDARENAIEATREALMRTPDGETVLVCSCPSTGKIFALEVDPGINNCESAQFFLSGGLSTRIVNGA